MGSSRPDGHVTATHVTLKKQAMVVDLADGRTLTVPLNWYPRLEHSTTKERNNWMFVGRGEGIHWPDLDEDVSVRNLLLGKPSSESQRSFQRWLEGRGGRGKKKL
jgi:Protein of unknown function (DUF2442)